MSREIKFRAWDEGNKVMHNNFEFIRSGTDDDDWIIFISDEFKLENPKKNPFKNPNPYFQQKLKIMQYTGVKDKNGVEIYEGDIVKGMSTVFESQKNIAEIIFIDGCFCCGEKGLNVYAYKYKNNLVDIEILKNIYD